MLLTNVLVIYNKLEEIPGVLHFHLLVIRGLHTKILEQFLEGILIQMFLQVFILAKMMEKNYGMRALIPSENIPVNNTKKNLQITKNNKAIFILMKYKVYKSTICFKKKFLIYNRDSHRNTAGIRI